MQFKSKLPEVETTIFTIMSRMAREHSAINLSQGFPDFPVAQQLKDLINKYVQQDYNQYAPMAGVMVLRQAIQDKVKLLYDRQVSAETDITITNGATEGLYSAISAFVSAGDEVITFEPAYDSYVPAIQVNGGINIPIRLSAPDYKIDWTQVADQISPRTKMIIINNPHNPTSAVLSQADLTHLDEITRNTDIIILSDEVYQHLIFDGQRHESVLRYPSLAERSIVTMSFGKTFHATGWRIGYVIAPKLLTAELRKVHQFNTFSINTPLQYALAEYLREPKHYQNLAPFFQAKRNLFADAIADSRFDLLPCQGTYFMLASYKQISEMGDQDFARWMTREKGVAVIPISSFYTDDTDQGIIRFCFAKSDGLLLQAAELINKI